MRLNPLFSCLAGALVLSLGQVSVGSAQAVLPDPVVEARVARELLAVAPRISKPSRGSDTDRLLADIAMALARLGRMEAALKVVGQMELQDAEASNGAPYTRAEVLRLVVRRRCMMGKLDEARQLIPAITVPRLRADALLALSRAHLRRNEMEQARQTLYLISPLVEKDVSAMSYTAYLLSKSGDLNGAKRLFVRARKQLTPLKPTKSATADAWDSNNIRARGERSALIHYLFNTGLIDEAIRVEEATRSGQAQDRFLPVSSSEQLARVNRFEPALRIAREEGGYRGVSSRVYVATMIDKRRKDREGALKILAEAETEYHRLKLESKEGMRLLDEELPGFTMRLLTGVLIAYGYRELGQEESARLWLENILKDLEPETATIARVYFSILPLVIATHSNSATPFDQLKKIDAEVSVQLSRLKGTRQVYDLYIWLVRAYFKVGQPEATRFYLPRLERFAFAAISAKGGINSYHSCFELLRFWRELGDEAQVQRLLRQIEEFPLPSGTTRHDVARAMIYNGFVAEGRARLAALPAQNSNRIDSHDIGIWEARYQPHIFPPRIAGISDLQARLQELVNFTRGLTASIYEAPQERELVLSAGGYSSSY